MTIERDRHIRFHELGTLDAVTRWVSRHDEGIAEWLKNARAATRADRGKVAEQHRVAVLLLRDHDSHGPARIGLLDVGGATLKDVTLWSVWQDPEASTRKSTLEDEGNQGNGGKAYMYRMFAGTARLLGVHAGRRNCKGFEGPPGSVDRGTPGFIPDAPRGRDHEVDWRSEVDKALDPYGLRLTKLPAEVQAAIKERQAFTLVEGVDPVGLTKGRVQAESLVAAVLRHEQSTLAVQQMRLYVAHDGKVLNGGKPCALEEIAPYPGIHIRNIEVPSELKTGDGRVVSTTEGGTKQAGVLQIRTSKENMLQSHRVLRPRWRLTYRTEAQMVGSKPIPELLPATPGSYFVYATLTLPALEPAYVDLGRRRPKDGPLVEAVDAWAAEELRAVAKQITDKRRAELDDKTLDEVHEENRRLDRFKNRFLPSEGEDRGEGREGKGAGAGGRAAEVRADIVETEAVPAKVDLAFSGEVLRVGRGVAIDLADVLGPRVRDAQGNPVQADVTWHLDGPAARAEGSELSGVECGRATVWAAVEGTAAESRRVPLEVWNVAAVELSPGELELRVGGRRQVTAKVTSDMGEQAEDVLLEWRVHGEDKLAVRVRPNGWVSGNRLGEGKVLAGAGDRKTGAWSKPVPFKVGPAEEKPQHGAGFPRLLLTGRDVDPATGQRREGDPDSPALWQEVTDYYNNVWWINLSSPAAAFAFNQRQEQPELWRTFHVQCLIGMITQVYMQQEFTKRGDAESKEHWGIHRDALWRHEAYVTNQMWGRLQPYVATGKLE